jgi:CheY-like chemotaxis protein
MTAEECLREAQECLLLADSPSNADLRDHYLQLAKDLSELATMLQSQGRIFDRDDAVRSRDLSGMTPVRSLQRPRPTLIVEDEGLIRVTITQEFERAGMSAVAVASADKAVALFEDGEIFSAVITDIRMPGSMDGWGLVRWMSEHVPQVPVIVTSGYRIELEKHAPSVAAVVPKPYDIAKVISLVRSAAA